MKDTAAGFVDETELRGLLSDLVARPSYAGTPGRELAVAEYIVAACKSVGIEARLEDAGEGMVNALAVLRGSGGGPSLLLCGHSDTVPPYDMESPWELREMEPGRLHGRGAVDMKGPLASMIGALLAVKRSGERLRGGPLARGRGGRGGGLGRRHRARGRRADLGRGRHRRTDRPKYMYRASRS